MNILLVPSKLLASCYIYYKQNTIQLHTPTDCFIPWSDHYPFLSTLQITSTFSFFSILLYVYFLPVVYICIKYINMITCLVTGIYVESIVNVCRHPYNYLQTISVFCVHHVYPVIFSIEHALIKLTGTMLKG